LIFAAVALRLGKSLLPESLPRMNEVTLNWKVAGFALLLAIVTGLVCGLAPAFAALRTNVNGTLKEGGRSGSAGGGHARLRSTLVVAEIAIALVLLTASGLLLRSFEKMRSVDLGFRPEHVTTAAYSLPQKQYQTQAAVTAFNNELIRRLRELPGAQTAGLTSFLPATNNSNNQTFVAEGYAPPKGAGMNLATTAKVNGDYLPAMGIPLLRGRFFTDADKAGAQPVVMVNRKLAQHFWPNQNPIGKRLRIGTLEMKTPWMVIVGEVADIKLSSPDQPTKEEYYLPVEQMEDDLGSLASPGDIEGDGGYIVLRSTFPPEQMENALRATVRSIDPQLALTQVQTMVEAVSQTEAPRRFNTVLISSFAMAAVLLAVLGIYSVIAFSVASRVQEMAIRMALGSQRAGIIRLIVISGAKLAGIGCLLGLLGAAADSALLRSLLFGVSPFDPLVLTLAAAAVLLLAVSASALPALRAASIDPMQALRGE
jgi:putative ABC transport system permease protein